MFVYGAGAAKKSGGSATLHEATELIGVLSNDFELMCRYRFKLLGVGHFFIQC